MNFIFLWSINFIWLTRKMNEGDEMKDGKDDENEEDTEGQVKLLDDCEDGCSHCVNNPCISVALDPLFQSILKTYGWWKKNKEICFHMHSDAIKSVYGPGIEKGVRKRHPQCVHDKIRSLAPDKTYMGIKEVSNN